MFLTLLSSVATYSYPGFGYLGKRGRSIAHPKATFPNLPTLADEYEQENPEYTDPFEGLNPNKIAKVHNSNNKDHLISRANLLIPPVTEKMRDRMAGMSDHFETVPYDTTKGFLVEPDEANAVQEEKETIENVSLDTRRPSFYDKEYIKTVKPVLDIPDQNPTVAPLIESPLINPRATSTPLNNEKISLRQGNEQPK